MLLEAALGDLQAAPKQCQLGTAQPYPIPQAAAAALCTRLQLRLRKRGRCEVLGCAPAHGELSLATSPQDTHHLLWSRWRSCCALSLCREQHCPAACSAATA